MRRLFWMGVGAVGAVVLAQRARRAVQALPETMVDQVGRAGDTARQALRSALRDFTAARAERETELVTALLTEPEAGTARRPRHEAPPTGARSPSGARLAAADDDDEDDDEDDDL